MLNASQTFYKIISHFLGAEGYFLNKIKFLNTSIQKCIMEILVISILGNEEINKKNNNCVFLIMWFVIKINLCIPPEFDVRWLR